MGKKGNRKSGFGTDGNESHGVQPMLNTQRDAYQITINNPSEHGYSHLKIKEIFQTQFKTVKYFCMADEISASGTYHTHIYVILGYRVRWSTASKRFPGCHIEEAHGTVESNINYIKKEGKWAESEKAETRVEGTFESYGTIPVQKGKRPDMEELYNLVKDGYSNAEILAINNDYIKDIDKIDKIRVTLLTDKYKDERRTGLTVTYIQGETGAGKTRFVLDEYGDRHVYRITSYKNCFDQYSCEPVLCFEEFRDSLPIGDMLNYCDIYPIKLPARYVDKVACYEKVFIISNWTLEKQYLAAQANDRETYKAFLRRITEVVVFNKDGTTVKYDSVEAYMNRWRNVEDDEGGLPFDD